MEEKELIISLKNGNKDAFASLYNSYWKKVYNFSRLYITSVADAEEIVQQIFVKVWETRADVNEELNFKNYLFTITRNAIFNQNRKKFYESFYQLSVINALNDCSYSIEEEMEAEDLREFIDHLLNDLTPRQKEVFTLSRKEQCTYKEIAERLSISEKTVERHISDALKYIRKNLLLYALFIYVLNGGKL